MTHVFSRNVLAGVLISSFAGSAFTNMTGVDQLDEADRQEFNANVARATACSKARDFQCATHALAQAKKYANGSRDRAALKAAAEKIELMRQMSIQDDAKNKYSAEKAELEARSAESEREIVESRRALANAQRSDSKERQRQAQQDREDRQSALNSEPSIGAYIQQKGAEAAVILGNVDRQINAAVNESNRVLASRAAEQQRARAQGNARDRSSPTARKDPELQHSRQQAEQAREQEAGRQKQTKEAAEKLAVNSRLQSSPVVNSGKRDSGSQPPSAPVQIAQGPGTADNPDDKGCFIPQRRPHECVVAEGSWARGSSGEYRVKYTNNCRERVYHHYAIEMKNGKWDTGSHGIPSGSSQTWSTAQGTGRFNQVYTGSARSSNDWVCTERDPVFKADYRRLTR